MPKDLPKHYSSIKERFPEVMENLEKLGETLKNGGPVDIKNAHLIQLAGAATVHSEGSVHSHVKRAKEAGASDDEIYHAVLLLTSTIGFPRVAAAISWVDDVIGE